jgi:hypothetical protein
MPTINKKSEKTAVLTKTADNSIQNDVEGRSEAPTDLEARQMARESNGRVTRPSTAEVRYEAMRLSKENGTSEFEKGLMTALEWVLGDRRTLRRP